MRTTLGAAASGAATGSGLTQATARLLGRTTASTGAIEELSATAPLSLASGAIAISAATTGAAGSMSAADKAKLDGIATGAVPRWTAVANFTATPASTSTITMGTDQTAMLLPGLPLRYTYNGATYYGVIAACTANLLTIRGAPLSTSYTTTLDVGTPEMVKQLHISVPGYFEDATNTGLLASDCYQVIKWTCSRAYCVGYNAKCQTADGGATQPSVQVTWGGNAISTANSAAGIRPGASWVATDIDISPTNYVVDYNEALEISVTKNSTGDAADLNVDILMVVP
jgi:hypothetical protein